MIVITLCCWLVVLGVRDFDCCVFLLGVRVCVSVGVGFITICCWWFWFCLLSVLLDCV